MFEPHRSARSAQDGHPRRSALHRDTSEIESTIVRGTLFGFAATSTLALLPLVATS
ncbi:hypothetical protein EOA79_03855 [Mesorhizobium sp. M1A.F.Ca.IN.020.03.2.1]|nr:hypothetical protein EOA79_03855 [Mesorhizobium sp. M1A.F.Ca.IN.020.03.2.1]RUV24325.1 hypothetical protein EOA91_12370 [Mesorhizobium sp. M1A.F.Ca.IN.022.04.1.1]RWB32754.1 MAG: hypothetical protein EOQ43_06870 [Mesorhizobium sp.]RWE67108.1 MAG: hypothetical protein EOS62_17425 [Mesorhizobium sp.]RWG36850.1 MAG: hypothetical protein EOQ60_03225 [Mesorhizobium sp.]